MTLTLSDICEKMGLEIDEKYEIGHGDAEDLFKQIWGRLTAGPNGPALQNAINAVEDAFTI